MAKRTAAKQKRLVFSNDFYSDLEADDLLHALLIRSPVSVATLVSVSHPHLPDGYHLFTAQDVSGKQTIATLGEETPVFCTGEIRYQGEPLGILVGADEKKLHDLLNGVEIRYEERMDDPKKLLAERVVQTNPQIDDLMATADITVEERWSCNIHSQSYSEPNGAFCFYKAGTLHVFTPSQWLSHLRTSLADVTGIAKENITITRTQFSELDTNTLWINSQLAAQVAICALKTGKPVKLVLSRKEQQHFIENTAPVTITHKTGLNNNGEIVAADVSITADGGAYNPFAREFIDRLCIASCNVYNPQAVRIHGQVFRSAQPPYSVDLAAIDSHAFYAIENHLQKIAECTPFTPLELRQKNYRTDEKQQNFMPFQLNCENVQETLEAVCRTSDFTRKYISYHLNETTRYEQDNNSPFAPPLRGAGLSCGFSGSGFYGTTLIKTSPSLEVTLESDGRLLIHALPTSQSVWAIWTKIVKETLGIEENKVVLHADFNVKDEPEAPDTISSNISVMTQLLQNACDAIRRKKDTASLPFTVKKTLAASKKKLWNKEFFFGVPFHTTAFAACVVEVELDPSTYRENIRGIWVVIDAGKILSVKAAEYSVKASIQQTLRELVEDDTVRCTNIRVQFIQSNSEPKQIGDVVYAILPAAFTSALSQALAITMTRLPIQNDTLYKLTKKALRLRDERIAAEQQAEAARAQAEKDAAEAPAEVQSDDTLAAVTDLLSEGQEH